jgi:DNA-directed RNA polymerase subunit RPC12/RpoP
MKLAEILANKRAVRCPACGEKPRFLLKGEAGTGTL